MTTTTTTSRRKQVLLTICCWVGLSRGFAPLPLQNYKDRNIADRDDSFKLMMAKRKPSMAERRKRRAAKNKSATQTKETLPQCKLDFKTKQPISISGMGPMSDDEAMTATSEGLDASKTKTKAQQLIDAQRASVAMLTHVKEKILELPTPIIQEALNENGYIVIDGFLGNDDNCISVLQEEGRSMLRNMEADLANLGSGEYTVALRGGEEQYTQCPRSVEFVVSSTKHMPGQLGDESLDDNASMTTLRTFDRKALKASLALLTGNEDEDLINESKRPFGIIASEENDQRKISLLYYIVSPTWDDSCGGGLTFEGDGATVEAKRDRLVIMKSDTCSFRRDPWKGSDEDENMVGTCLELHLVLKNEQEDERRK
jgi:hypothetical protein